MSTNNTVFDTEELRRLNLTQTTREKIISNLLKDGKIPEDKEDRQFLMQALDGLDRTTLSTAKIKSDDNASKGKQETARMIADLLTKVNLNSTNTRTSLPVLDAEIILENPVPGETDIGVKTFSFNEIMN